MVLKLLGTVPSFLTSCFPMTYLCFLMPLILTWKLSKIVSINSMIGLVFLLIIRSLPSPLTPIFHNLPEMPFCNHIGLKPSDPQAVYLSLPLHIKCGQASSFNSIIEKINNRFSRWKVKVLSQASRAMLIKSVLSSIPTYWISSFQLPISTCHRIDAKLRDFF